MVLPTLGEPTSSCSLRDTCTSRSPLLREPSGPCTRPSSELRDAIPQSAYENRLWPQSLLNQKGQRRGEVEKIFKETTETSICLSQWDARGFIVWLHETAYHLGTPGITDLRATRKKALEKYKTKTLPIYFLQSSTKSG